MIDWMLPWILAWGASEIRLAYAAEPVLGVDYAEELRLLAIDAQPKGEDHSELFTSLLADHGESWKSVYFELNEANLLDAEFWPDMSLVYDEAGWHDSLIDIPLCADMPLAEQRALLAAVRTGYIEWLDSWDQLSFWARFGALRTTPGFVVFDLPDPLSLVLMSPPFELMSQARNLARACRAQMFLALERDDAAGYVRAVDAALSIADVCEAQPALLTSLNGVAIRSLTLKGVREDLLSSRLPAAAVKMLLDRFRGEHRAGIEHVLRGEFYVSLNVVQNTYDSRGRQIPSILETVYFGSSSNDSSSKLLNISSLFMPRRPHVEGALREVHARAIAHASMTPRARLDAIEAGETIDDGVPWFLWQASVSGPAVSQAIGAWHRSETERLGMLVLLAIERHRVELGQLPESLDDLVPAYLGERPLDPWSTASLLRYERDESRLGYTLYTVGADAVDNGGTAAERVYDAFGPDAEGIDFLFTQP